MRNSAKHVVILGTPIASGNRGVLALGASLVNLCFQASDGGPITLLLSHREHTGATFLAGGQRRTFSVVPMRMSPRARLADHFLWIVGMACLYRLLPLRGVRRTIERSTPWIRAVAEADVAGDIRGGDSFSDIYGLRGFLEGCAATATIILVKGNAALVHFPQTFGPYKHPIARMVAKLILRRSGTIIARDEESRRVAQQLVGDRRRVLLSPDVAFSLTPIRPARIAVAPTAGTATDVPPGTIGINVNGLMYHGGYTRQNMFGLQLDYAAALVPLVTALLQERPGEVWLVPHTYAAPGNVESDQDACAAVRAALPPDLALRVRVVTGEYDQYEIKGIIGQFDFFVGSRMHACIAALSQGVPCVGIAYSRKFEGVFASVGMRDWVVDARSFGNTEAISRTLELYRCRENIRRDLAQQATAAREQLADVFRTLLNSPGAGGSAMPQIRPAPSEVTA